MAQRRWSLPVAAATSIVVAWRIARGLGHVRRPSTVAARLTGFGLVSALAQGSALLLRHWWPVAAIGCVFSRRVRRAVLAAAVVDTVADFACVRSDLDPVRFAGARRLDDAAYGAGVWWGALRSGSLRAVLPAIVRTSRVPDR